MKSLSSLSSALPWHWSTAPSTQNVAPGGAPTRLAAAWLQSTSPADGGSPGNHSRINGFTWEFWGEAMVWSKTVGDAASSVSMLSLTSIVGLEGRGKKWPSNCWHHCTKGIWWGFNSAEKQRDCSGLSRTGDAAFPKLGSCKQWLCETPSKHLMWLFLPWESKSQHILPFTYSVFDLLASTSLHLKTAKISPESGPKSE